MLAMLATDVAAREVWPSCSSPACDPPFTFGAVMLIRELTLLNASTLPLALLQVIVAVLQRQEHSVSCHSSAEFDEVDGARCSC